MLNDEPGINNPGLPGRGKHYHPQLSQTNIADGYPPIAVAGGYQSPVHYLLNYFYDVNEDPGINNPGHKTLQG